MKIRNTVIAFAILLSACGGQTDSSVRASNKRMLPVARLQTSVKQQLLASDYENTVQALYVAYFGRPADPAGLTNFENALLAIGAPTDVIGLANAYPTNPAIAALIDSFGNSAESKALYGSGDSKSFVTAIFNNVLSRSPQSGAGLDFWASAIDNGSLSKGNAALSIMAGAIANTSVQGHIDAITINNRLVVAGYFTTCVTNENAQSAYVGAAAAAAARADLVSLSENYGGNYYEPVEKAVTALFPASVSYLELIVGAQGAMDNEPAGLASLNYPQGLAVDLYGNLYYADTNSNSIRMVSAAGAVTTFAGVVNCGNSAQGAGPTTICQPTAVAIDSHRNIYTNNGPSILKISQSGTVTVFAGQFGAAGFADGTGAQAKFANPAAIAIDASDTLYVADNENSTIRKITPDGVVTTLAGNTNLTGSTNGYGANASFADPGGIAVGSDGTVYVADTNNSLIRAITPTGLVSTLAGSIGPVGHKDGQGSAASFNFPTALAIDVAGNILVCDSGDGIVRRVTPAGAVVTVMGPLDQYVNEGVNFITAQFIDPMGIAVDTSGNIYVADTQRNVIDKFNLSTLASSHYVGTTGHTVQNSFPVTTSVPPPLPAGIGGIGTDSSGNSYVADVAKQSVFKVDQQGNVIYLAGKLGTAGSSDGQGLNASFNFEYGAGVAIDASGNIFVADAGNFTIRKVTSTGAVTTFAGTAGMYGHTDATGTAAQFGSIGGMAFDRAGNLYVVDSNNECIRKITPEGVVTTFAGEGYVDDNHDGKGKNASINNPSAIAIDSQGNVYVTQSYDNLVRKITPDGTVTTLAGINRTAGSQNGPGATATFKSPYGIVVDASGNVFVSENTDIRMISPSGIVSTYDGVPGHSGLTYGALPGLLLAPATMSLSGNTLFFTYGGDTILAIRNLP